MKAHLGFGQHRQQEQGHSESGERSIRARPSEKKCVCTSFSLRVKILTREHVTRTSFFVAPAASNHSIFGVTVDCPFRCDRASASGRHTSGPSASVPCPRTSTAFIAPRPQQEMPLESNEVASQHLVVPSR